MKIHKLVNILGAMNDTGKLASDMYNLGKKRYYSEAHGQEIPISEMDFQHMVRAFVKLSEQEDMLDRSKHMGRTRDLVKKVETRDYTLEELRKEKDEALDEGVSLANQVEGLKELLKEKEALLDKWSREEHRWRKAYYDQTNKLGKGYVFSEIPNDTDGQEFVDKMKKYFNNKTYKMRVRGQHIKPELRGTGATYWGQNISESTHMRVYIDTRKGEDI